MKSRVPVEKLPFRPNGQDLGDTKRLEVREDRQPGFARTTIPTVSRLFRPVFLLIVALAHSASASSAPPSKVETITGQVVAYSGGLACLNGNSYWSMLIRVEKRTPLAPPEFLQVDFSLPCDQSPKWLNRKPPMQKFRLRRKEDADSVLKEFFDCAPTSSPPPNLEMWKRVPGAEKEQLPFGNVVPSYRSLDLPLVPVV